MTFEDYDFEDYYDDEVYAGLEWDYDDDVDYAPECTLCGQSVDDMLLLVCDECAYGYASTRQERRAQRRDNGRKMRVSGRSASLLHALATGQQRPRRRKKGGA